MKDSTQKIAPAGQDLSDLPEKERRLELNRAAAMRSRLKKKQELEYLQKEADELSAAKAASEKRVMQFEALLQASYTEAALTQSRLMQAVNDRAVLQLRLKELLGANDDTA